MSASKTGSGSSSALAGKNINTRNPAIKRIMREYAEFQASPSTDYVAQPCDDNLFEWHFTLRGAPGTEFEGGRYHGRILLPSEYPFKPPDIILLTPSGRFQINEKICLSISSFHPKNWQPSWSIRTVLIALTAFFPTPGNGAIGSLDYPITERKAYAKRTADWRCELCGKTNAQMLPDLPPTAATATAATATAATATDATKPGTGAAAAAAVTGATPNAAAAAAMAALISNLTAATPAGQSLPPPVPASPAAGASTPAATVVRTPSVTALPAGSPPATPISLASALASMTPQHKSAVPAPAAPVHADGVDDAGWATAPAAAASTATPTATPTLSRKPSSSTRSIPLTSRLMSGSLSRGTSAVSASPPAPSTPIPAVTTAAATAATAGIRSPPLAAPLPLSDPNPNTIIASFADFNRSNSATHALPPLEPAAASNAAPTATAATAAAATDTAPAAPVPLFNRQWSIPTLGMPDVPPLANAPALPALTAPAHATATAAASVPYRRPNATATATASVAPAVATANVPSVPILPVMQPQPLPAAATAFATGTATNPVLSAASLTGDEIRREREVARQRRERFLSNLTVTILLLIFLVLVRKFQKYASRHNL